MQVWPGTAYPLGATFDGSGTNFALFSNVADAVELCRDDEVCDEANGRCEEFDCDKGEYFCRDNDLWKCDNNGKATLDENCDRDEVCDDRLEKCVSGVRCEDDLKALTCWGNPGSLTGVGGRSPRINPTRRAGCAVR